MATMRFLRFLTLCSGLLLMAACGNGGPGTPEDPDLVTVTGTVVHIDNQIPVDGGITLELRLDPGQTELLLFTSLFTDPPPSEETLALYEIVRRVQVNDRVRAVGKRQEHGLLLQGITILQRE